MMTYTYVNSSLSSKTAVFSVIGALLLFFVALTLLVPQSVNAQGLKVLEEKPLPDAEMEQRARTYMKGIRCLVCQNQAIEESDADMARDLRILIRERFANGETEAQISAYLVERYGDWILMNPPLSSKTWLLWSAPFLIFLLALTIVWLRRKETKALVAKGQNMPQTQLSAEEKKRLTDILNQGDNT